MNSNIPNCIHIIIHINSSYSCGIPREHVLRISDELRHEMIHVQNWKIYTSRYNDDSSKLGLELNKAQLDYKLYGKQMILSSSGARNGKDGELTFPAFHNRKQKRLDKRFKGYLG
jgi:hypothetical protein